MNNDEESVTTSEDYADNTEFLDYNNGSIATDTDYADDNDFDFQDDLQNLDEQDDGIEKSLQKARELTALFYGECMKPGKSHEYTSKKPATSGYEKIVDDLLQQKKETDKKKQSTARLKMSDQRKKIEERLETLGDYENKSLNNFKAMRDSLRDVGDRMITHRLLLDKYAAVDLDDPKSVKTAVAEKYKQLTDRIPSLETPVKYTKNKDEMDLYYHSPTTVNGYAGGMLAEDRPAMSELRGRIRRLLCRSKNNPHYYRI